MNQNVLDLIHKKFDVDLTSLVVRQRAWRRITVFRGVAQECEDDGNIAMAETLRRICTKAIDLETEETIRLCYMAMLAGPESVADSEITLPW